MLMILSPYIYLELDGNSNSGQTVRVYMDKGANNSMVSLGLGSILANSI